MCAGVSVCIYTHTHTLCFLLICMSHISVTNSHTAESRTLHPCLQACLNTHTHTLRFLLIRMSHNSVTNSHMAESRTLHAYVQTCLNTCIRTYTHKPALFINMTESRTLICFSHELSYASVTNSHMIESPSLTRLSPELSYD